FQRLHLLLLCEDAKSCSPPGQIRDKGSEHILDNSGAGNQVEGLEDHADPAAKFPQAFSVQGHHVGAVYRQLALGNVVHSVDGTNQGGLARAGQTDDSHKLPLVNGQADVLQGLESIRITLFYFFEFYHYTLPIPNEGGKPRPPSL